MADHERLSAYIKLIKLKQLVLFCLQGVKDPCIESATRMGFTKKGRHDKVALQVTQKNEYFYDGCDDHKFNELVEAIKGLEKKVSDRKKFLRGLSEPTYDENDQLILPPEIESKQSISVSF
jgi:hypothetical protein